MTSLYIHFPYCLYKCEYCDFNSFAYARHDIPEPQYIQALLTEWSRRRDLAPQNGGWPGGKISTIFFGGGTPSLMQPQFVQQILKTVSDTAGFSENCEITLESNPGTVTRELFSEFRAAGVTRISLGLQSLNDKFLKNFGRIHTAAEGIAALEAALQANLEVSADLIFGFPGQTFAEWHEDLEKIAEYSLKHLSAYALTVEPGTTFAQKIKKNHVAIPDADVQTEMFLHTRHFLAAKNLMAYEISNFAVLDHSCRHNLAYWNYENYLGLGAGACSQFVEKNEKSFSATRWTNAKAPELYMRELNVWPKSCEIEAIESKTSEQEFLMMGLRLKQGPDLKRFRSLSGEDLIKKYLPIWKIAEDKGWVKIQQDRVEVSEAGMLMNHQLVGMFF